MYNYDMDDNTLYDADGKPLHKLPNCPACGENELGSHYEEVWCCKCGFAGVLLAPGVVESAE